MAYMTDRKRAEGLGSAKSGTDHFWSMTKSSIGLLILVPLFIFTFGSALGSGYEQVVAYYSQPFPAIVAALTITVGWVHFKSGAQTMIEDYSHGLTRHLLIAGVTCISYAAIAAGLFALVRLAI
ncbi:succinate dehydrogenase subunit D [Palleronia salina]|mgnify:CR=1 FL=1|uniref:Succinate dehydrogenase hydrophobic membrane anchor subunit n=2 Tax=Palleronia TaxID=315422 RepID=A0A1M6HPZ5_9RHOB|nr:MULTISPECIES: succinate dehydrogenase, hydrophobic membrane anchor protein [Palleronia]SEM74112.1 succinate dehydrogenase subunit D [Palleronia pelagia]SHJ24282.1 succinate dehydrogenase subunit D [Palleronia salina]